MNYFEVYVNPGKDGYSAFFGTIWTLKNRKEIIAAAIEKGEIEAEDVRYVKYAKKITKTQYMKATYATTTWLNNGIQFPRLIAELNAAGTFQNSSIMKDLRKSMNLSTDQIMELVKRAEDIFESVKHP